jgi:hypothetical protein
MRFLLLAISIILLTVGGNLKKITQFKMKITFELLNIYKINEQSNHNNLIIKTLIYYEKI